MKSPFPQDWKEYTIGDCLRRVEHPVEVDSDALYTQIGIRSHGKGLFYKEPVTGELLGSKAVYWVEPDCFILNIVFAWEQAIGKTTQAEVGMIGSHRFPMYKPVNNLIDIDYLVYYLLTKRGTDILEAASPGGAGRNRTLGQDRFMKSRIVLPPLDEQKKIAKILSTQDKSIELQGRKIEELKRFKKGCLERMFPRKGQKVPEKRFPGFTDDWEQRKLGDMMNVTSVKRIHQSDWTDSGVRFLRARDIVAAAKNEEPDDYLYISKEKYEEYSALSGKVSVSDLLVTGVGTIGVPYLVRNLEPLYFKDGNIIWFQNSDKIDGKFLFYSFSAEQIQGFINESAGIGTVGTYTIESGKKTPISLPNQIEQAKVGEFFQQLDDLITLHQRKLEEMKKQKKALMQLLLTGIVRVDI